MESNPENPIIPIEDLEYFYRYSQFFCICDCSVIVETLDTKITLEEKEHVITQYMEDNVDMLTATDYMDDIINIGEVIDVVEPILQKDITTGEFYVEAGELNKQLCIITQRIVYNFLSYLVDIGEMKMCWCDKKEDFIFVPTDNKEPKRKKRKK